MRAARRWAIVLAMLNSLTFGLGALATLVPAAAIRFRPDDRRDVVFWAMLAVGVIGPAGWAAAQLNGVWRTGFAMSLGVTIAGTMALFFLLSVTMRQLWRLTPILVPYLLVLGAAAIVWQHAPERPIDDASIPAGWMQAHILLAVATYSLSTLAAVAGFAVVLQERALKRKRPTALTRLLPAIAESENIQVGLLMASALVLALGLLSGMAAEWYLRGRFLTLDHKTIFSLAAFAVIALLLVAHSVTGVRGRRAARYVLVAYLLLTLAFPGVKFVTDVLLS